MFDRSIDNLNRERGVLFSQTEVNIYTGEVAAGEEKVWLSIDLGQGFPKTFPIISILDGKRFIPHSSSGGKLCLFDESSVMVKPDSPEQLLLDSYDRAIEILKMDPETQKEEVFREFFAYWGNQSQAGFMLYTNLAAAETREFKEYTVIGDKVNRLVVSDNLEESKALLVNHMGCAPSEAEKHKIPCYRIRLRSSSLPKMNESFTWKNIRGFILDNITGSQKRRFNQKISEKCSAVNHGFTRHYKSLNGEESQTRQPSVTMFQDHHSITVIHSKDAFNGYIDRCGVREVQLSGILCSDRVRTGYVPVFFDAVNQILQFFVRR